MLAELKDLESTADGDIVIGANGDLSVVRNEDVVSQEIRFRLKTCRGDWLLFPDAGADLESLIGQANSPITGSKAESLVSRSLTHDDFLGGEIEILRAVPLNKEQIAILISVSYGDKLFTSTVVLNLQEGVLK